MHKLRVGNKLSPYTDDITISRLAEAWFLSYNHHMNEILEPAKSIPVVEEVDLCVLGGSCTGVFAAIRAARLGLRVVIVEKTNCFGGTATNGLVNIWHSLFDTSGEQQIIAGLTQEVLERLKRRGAVVENGIVQRNFTLNTEELKIELDECIGEAGVIPRLHTLYVSPFLDDGRLTAIIIEDKNGRGAIRARYFIDATGDGDLCAHLGIPYSSLPQKQPPTTCAKILGLDHIDGVAESLRAHGDDYGLPEGFAWWCSIPGYPNYRMHAASRVFGVDCSDARALTSAEIEGRRQIRAMLDIIRHHLQPVTPIALASLSSSIGIRETRHIDCHYELTEADVLNGRSFPDTIAYSSYPVDIHLDDAPGVLFRYFDGRECYSRIDFPQEWSRWRPETLTNPTFAQIPYRCLLPKGPYENLLVAGRAIDADRGAFASIRVMVNANQTGEAAGVAVALALRDNVPLPHLDPATLRATLAAGGSISNQ